MCFIVLIALLSPRLAIILMWLFTSILERAYDHSFIVPFLGFLLLPWTTIVYALCWDSGSRGVIGFEWLLVAMAFLIDVASWGFGRRGSQRRGGGGGSTSAPART